jgi:hypothetical protein
MMMRSVFLFIGAAALTLAAPLSNASLTEARQYASTITLEADSLEAIASMQNLDWRSHQTQLGNLRAAVNGLGQALAGAPEGPMLERAREVAALVTQAIEILNDHAGTVLPPSYRETAKKLSAAAGRLQREVKVFSAKNGSE